MIPQSNKKIVKIIETTKGQIYSPFSNPDQQVKLIIFNEIFNSQPSKYKSNYSIDLQHLNYHRRQPFSLQNSSIAWASLQHEIRQLLSKRNQSEEDLLVFESSSYNQKIPQIFNRFKIVKGYNYRIRLESFQNLTQDKKALLTFQHVLKQIQLEFSLGNGSFKPGYIGEIIFQELSNPIFKGLIQAYQEYSSKTNCPIVINFASQGQETYQIVFKQDSSKIIEKFSKKFQILNEFLNRCATKNCSKNIILYNLPIIIIQQKSSSNILNYFQNRMEQIVKKFGVTLGLKALRYSYYNEKYGIDQVIKIINKFPQNVILSAGIRYKTDLTVNSGQGLSIYNSVSHSQNKSILHMNSIEYMRNFIQDSILEKVLKGNILKLFDWKQMKQEVKIEIFWKCDSCKQDFSQTIKAFGKFGKQFCSIKCLKAFKF